MILAAARRFQAGRSDSRSDAGFTLIELLAVVAIIAIVGSLALAKVSESIEKARIAKAIAEVSRIHRAVEQYRALSGGNLPLQMSDIDRKSVV